MAATWTKAVDGGILLPFFIVLSLGAPLIDSQICLPSNLFPNQLVELKNWYAAEFDDYLLLDPPAFFVNLVWFEILFIWPLSVACAYAVTAGGRSWFPKACLSIGVAVSTSMVSSRSGLLLVFFFKNFGGMEIDEMKIFVSRLSV